jgi:transposase-like protein
MLNRYIFRSKILEKKFREIIRYFAKDFTATDISDLTRISRVTINRLLMEMRRIICKYCKEISPIDEGEIELDESYFGSKRTRGKRGRGAGNKIIVFGLFKRNGKVYTHIVPDAKATTLLPLIRGQVSDEVAINTDSWRSYDGLVDMGYQKHYRVNHAENEFVRGRNHVNGIEGFWGYAKHRLVKFNGVKKELFELHLKECEYRFNLRGDKDIYHNLLKLFRENPLFIPKNNKKEKITLDQNS